ncbi:hypothetical protein D3C76_1229390 [compost metagenome]
MPLHPQALVGFDDPGAHLQFLALVGGEEIVDLMANHGHGAVQAAVLGQVEPQALRVAPCAALQPAHVDGVVGVAEAVDVFGLDLDIDHERIGQIPTHA